MFKNEIILLEDDQALGEGLKYALEIANFSVNWFKSINELESSKKGIEKYCIAIFDIMLSDGNGIDLITNLRKNGLGIPIILLTAYSDEDYIVKGLEAGADDFLKKPIGHKELVARIRNHLRKTEQIKAEQKVEFLVEEKSLRVGNKIVPFNNRQLKILKYLFSNIGKIVKRDDLLKMMAEEAHIAERTLDSHVSQIRKKIREYGIKECKLNSVYGVGYRLEIYE